MFSFDLKEYISNVMLVFYPTVKLGEDVVKVYNWPSVTSSSAWKFWAHHMNFL
jgi:hypothetical protein